MLAKLIALSLAQRLLVLLAAVGLAIGGTMAFQVLPIDAFPDVSTTQVKIIIKAPGMTPEEVETRITAPIERKLLGIPRQTILRSQSKYAIAAITLDFEDGTDIYWARQQVTERLTTAQKDLPDSAVGGLAPITTPLGEMFMFTIEGDISLAEKRTLLDWVIRPALRGIRGVADVNALGGLVKSFEVVADPAALAARQLSLADLQTALQTNNRNDGAGRLSENEEALLVRTEGSIRTLDDVRAIPLGMRNGVPVRVGDIATVKIGSLTHYGSVTKDGKGEAVEGQGFFFVGSQTREQCFEDASLLAGSHQIAEQRIEILRVTTKRLIETGARLNVGANVLQQSRHGRIGVSARDDVKALKQRYASLEHGGE